MQAYSCGQSGVLATNVVITIPDTVWITNVANKILSLAEVQLTVFGMSCVSCMSCVCVVCVGGLEGKNTYERMNC